MSAVTERDTTRNTSLPATMRAIDPDTAGGPEVLTLVERPVPAPGAGEVLVRVAAAGVNRPDVMQRRGLYPPPPGAPSIPGLELSGEVVALGAGADPALSGQRVCALVAGGAYADYAVVPAGLCLPVPAALDMTAAAAMPETLFTVWTNLFERAYAVEGDTVLVHGGTSGIGTMAIALCRLFGVEIVVTAGSDEKTAAARALGADHAINYRTEDFVARVKEITGGRGVDVSIECVGSPATFGTCLESLAPGTTYFLRIKAIRDGHHGYTPATGIAPLREAIAGDLHRRFGVEVDSGRVMVVPGGKVTMFAAK